MISRRNFLTGLTLSGAAALLPRPLTAGSGDDRLLISAARKENGSFVLVGCTEAGATPFEIPLPGRGHATTISPDGNTAVHMARRPGRFMLVVDLGTGTLSDMVNAPAGRHFYGHAGFSPDGALLFTTENDYDNARGVIGIWDCRDGYRRVGEWDSHGIGPHDLTLLPHGGAMAIANGGILTHPDSGRAKLNIADMRPNLTFLDMRDGSFLRQIELPAELHKNSIRHLDSGPDGSVIFGMQYQGATTDAPPLVGYIGADGTCTLFDAEQTLTPQLRGYCADVAIDASGRFGASTFPRGDRIAIWSLPDGKLIELNQVRDSAGIAPEGHPGGFRFSTGFGRLLTRLAGTDGAVAEGPDQRFPGLAFDNHMTMLERAL
ncbi:DUF1513 domain-containing protein [Nisaea acidiphila]|uniref:DUF1513 domain-containing protein n=1 Tax=Nisaea acidiphila TaxID=1862145 RepID=A0A9J7AN60_9PROT|nr:DUF1513 domain-containing protein [Nisaea acidiphila]UUX48598.1 DUF1513 domain-containing protein [Nisaea acidiphila]